VSDDRPPSLYAIDITPEGRRQLNRLPDKVRSAVLAFVFESLAVNPRRVGKPLLAEMTGLWSARRAEYHVIYEIDDDNGVVLIHRAAHRRSVYRQ
jgi:mRNA-degrading endonuclease RelE of RelBE toxin-antitoxin system